MAKRILVVDDEEMITKSLSIRLTKQGYETEVASDGEGALGKFVVAHDKLPYDMLILDIMMPGLDGLELLKAIRREEELRGIAYGDGVPIIMLTALKQDWFKSFEAGCDDYIIKPFESDVLLAKVKEKIGE